MRRVPLDKAMELRAKIPGFDPIWLWEGNKRGLSFDLRKRIEAEEAKEHDDASPAERSGRLRRKAIRGRESRS